MEARKYTSNRYSIQKAVCELLKNTLNGEDGYTNVYGHVYPKRLFWDEVEEYPSLHSSLGNEQRMYQGGGYKDRFLALTFWCYVKDEEPQEALELLLQDIETVIEENGRLAYQDSAGVTQYTQDILIISMDTDEGALAPLGVGEMTLQIRY